MEFAPSTMRLGKNNNLKAVYYSSVIKAYQDIGLLTHIPLPARDQKPEFFQMCLARAEEYRLTRGHSNGPGPVLAEDLPLGPLGLIKFLHHKHLEKYLDGEQLNSECLICKESVHKHGTVLSMCACIGAPYCQMCVKNDLKSIHYDHSRLYDRNWDHRSYLSLNLRESGGKLFTSTKCYSCRAFSYTVSVDKVRDEDYRLIDGLREECGIGERIGMTLKRGKFGWYYSCVGESMIRKLTARREFQEGGKYQKLVPLHLITSLFDWVKSDECFSHAQRQAAIICRLLEAGPIMVDGTPTLPLGPSDKYMPLKDVILEAILQAQGEMKKDEDNQFVAFRPDGEEGYEVMADDDDEGADEDEYEEDEEQEDELNAAPLLPSPSKDMGMPPQNHQNLSSTTTDGSSRSSDHAPAAVAPPLLLSSTERVLKQERELYSHDHARSLLDSGMDVDDDDADDDVDDDAGSMAHLRFASQLNGRRSMVVDDESPTASSVAEERSSSPPPPPYPHPVDTRSVAPLAVSSSSKSSSSTSLPLASSSSSSSSAAAAPVEVADTAAGASSYRRIPKKARPDHDHDHEGEDDYIVVAAAAAATTDLPRSRYNNSNNNGARATDFAASRPLRAPAVKTTDRPWQQPQQPHQQSRAQTGQRTATATAVVSTTGNRPETDMRSEMQRLPQTQKTAPVAAPSAPVAAPSAPVATKTTALCGIPSRIVTTSGVLSTQGQGPRQGPGQDAYQPHPQDPRRQAAEARQAQATAAAAALQFGSATHAAAATSANGDNILATQQRHQHYQPPPPAGYLLVDPYATVLPLPVPVLPTPSLPHQYHQQHHHQHHHLSHLDGSNSLAYGHDGYLVDEYGSGFPSHYQQQHHQHHQDRYPHPQPQQQPSEYGQYPSSQWRPPHQHHQRQGSDSSSSSGRYQSRQEDEAAARGSGPSGLIGRADPSNNRDERKHRLWSERSRTEAAADDDDDDDDDDDNDDRRDPVSGEPTSSLSFATSGAATAPFPVDNAKTNASSAVTAAAGGGSTSGGNQFKINLLVDDRRTTIILHYLPGDSKITQQWLLSFICKKGLNENRDFAGSFDFFHFRHCEAKTYSHLPRNQTVKPPMGFLVSECHRDRHKLVS